jgi:hypothetical protein
MDPGSWLDDNRIRHTRPTERDASTGNGMSMADDHPLRSYRSNDPYRRASGTGEPASSSDPLAELARLIGQNNDTFTERRSPRQAEPAPPRTPSTAPQWPTGASRNPARETYADTDDHSRYAPSHAAASYARAPARQDAYARQEVYAEDDRQAYAADDRRYAAPSYDDPHAAEPDHRLQPYADEHAGYGVAQAGHAHGQQGHETDQHSEHASEHDAEHYYQDDAPLEPHEEEMYDDAPRARRHGGLVTALALIGCAMLGTAGAYGYRSYYTTAGGSDQVPVITADSATPPKVVPTTAIDPQANKAMDRLATAAGSEQLVRRQEEPVVLRELGTAAAPRVVLPAPGAPVQAAPSQNAPAATGSTNSGEPKRVRTVTIRPDGNDASGRPVGAAPAAPRAATTATTTPPAPRAAPAPAAPARGGPVSLDPQAAPTETAALPAARARPPATESSASTSGYLVQLASQKSESEAQSAFRSLQAKFPNELGSRQPVIRKADLGTKGVFYRTMVGPFRSAQEASQFCASYKAAGGQCVVPNN